MLCKVVVYLYSLNELVQVQVQVIRICVTVIEWVELTGLVLWMGLSL